MILPVLIAAGLLVQTAPTPDAPTPPVAVQRTPLDVTVPPAAGLTADPTCGGRQAMASIATCFVTTQAAVESVFDVWNTAFAAQNWLPADGEENRVLYVRRKDGGGCDAFQFLAFANDMQTAAPAAPAYLALAAIPGDICAAAAAPETPAAPQ